MVYTLWSMVSILSGLGAIYGFCWLFRVIVEKHGCLPALLLLALTTSVCSRHKPNNDPQSQSFRTVATASLPYSLPTGKLTHSLEAVTKPFLDHGFTKLVPYAYITPTARGDSVKISANAHLTGFVAGFVFEKQAADLVPLSPTRATLYLNGVLKWRFLQFTVYRQPIIHQQLVEMREPRIR